MARLAHRRGPVAGLALALIVLLAPGLAGPSAVPDVNAALPAWHGGIDLYRKGTFTTQKSWLWCTAADVQIIRNIVRDQRDHSTTNQRRYFTWMREHNRYTLPLSAGVDPAGWTAGLRHFVDDRYRLVSSRTFASALTSAVTNLRRTNLPVGITVSRGGHAWILTGFTATADPLVTMSFTVTSVRVVGPLFGLQSRNGYDMPPDTKLTPTQLRRYFTPWKYAPKPMIWDGRYVSIQPIAAQSAASAAAESPASPSASGPSAVPSASAAIAAGPSEAASLSTSAVPGAASTPTGVASQDAGSASVSGPSDDGPSPGLAIALVAVGLAGAILAVGVGRSIGASRAGQKSGQRAGQRLRQDR